MPKTYTRPAFWETLWQETKSCQKPDTSASKTGSFDRWNKLANDFSRRSQNENATKKRNATIRYLLEKGILNKNTSVLDIGAGPGAWALPMARYCAHVTALEPARGMTQILTDQMAIKKIDNICVDCRGWQEVDLEKDGWTGAFDLVFASMTPGIDGPAALKKMISASKNWCYLSAFSGPGWQQQYEPLWQRFFNRPMPERSNDILIAFNLLYTMGFRPDLTFSWWDREINWDREQTLRQFLSFFESHMEITPKDETVIADHVDRLCQTGEYRPARPVCRGTMIWSVREDKKTI